MKERIKRFIDFYRSQEIGRRKEIRDEFLRRSGLSYPSWGSKLNRENYTLLEIAALEDICGLSNACRRASRAGGGGTPALSSD